MSSVRKEFPGVVALRSANLEVYAGEIHALLGANGAGKSTLVKILAGVVQADDGDIQLNGQPVRFHSAFDAFHAGISTIFQEFSLVPSLSVQANLFLGREDTRHGFLNHAHERRVATEVLAKLGASLPLEIPVRELSVGHQQLVEIGRALARDARLLFMDEPTAALSPREVAQLFVILRDLASRGLGILFISHRVEEILSLTDRVTVIRDGATLPARETATLDRNQLIEMIAGRVISEEFPKRTPNLGDVVLDVRHLSSRRVRDISLVARRGEVLGLGGLVGAGRTELARLIFGADPSDQGEIYVNGKLQTIHSPHDAVRSGICLLTEDRKAEGLVLAMSVKDNFALANLSSWSMNGWIDRRRELSRFQARRKELSLRTSGPEQLASELSGGNQQKLLLARWLETDAQIVIFDEPTRGIDLEARHEMYELINRLSMTGKTILLISSEFTELLGVCDRILVMSGGGITGEIENVAEATSETIMALAV